MPSGTVTPAGGGGGASALKWVLLSITNAAPAMYGPTGGVPLVAAANIPSDIYWQASQLVGVVPAGGIVASYAVKVPAGVTNAVVEYLQLDVANPAGTQVASWTKSAATIVLVPGWNFFSSASDWNAPAGVVGSDLSVNSGGDIVSAAGGMFGVTATIELGLT